MTTIRIWGSSTAEDVVRGVLESLRAGRVLLHINSRELSGSSVDAILAAAEGRSDQLTGLVEGEACFAAFWLLQACGARLILPGARLSFGFPTPPQFFHEMPCAYHFPEGPDRMHAETWQRLAALATRSGQPLAALEDWAVNMRSFTAAEALRLGFVDQVVKGALV